MSFGPIDGHDLPTLVEFLREARDVDRPMVLHVKTVKGKGYDFAEGDSSTFHSPAPFVREGCRVELKKDGRSFTAAAGDAMVALMERDDKVVACTAAMPDGTGMNKVLPKFPERSFDVGICESHALDMMAGMAKTGFKPFFFVYSTFLQRAFDQAFQEVSLQGLAVRLCLDRAGLVGGDGAVHHGFCDISLLRTLPSAALVAPIDEASLVAAFEFMRGYEEGLSACRYPRDNVTGTIAERLGATPKYELGKAWALTPEWSVEKLEGMSEEDLPQAAVLGFGTPALAALAAADELAKEDYRVAVYDARFAKPVDTALISALLSRQVPVITVEDHGVIGGFGSAVIEAAQELGLDASRVTRLAIPDQWIIQDSRSSQLAQAGIDQAGVTRAIRASVAAASGEATMPEPKLGMSPNAAVGAVR